MADGEATGLMGDLISYDQALQQYRKAEKEHQLTYAVLTKAKEQLKEARATLGNRSTKGIVVYHYGPDKVVIVRHEGGTTAVDILDAQ